MGSIWYLANIEELEFAATATLLAIRAKQKSLCATERLGVESSDESESEYDEDEEDATSKSAAPLNKYPRNILMDKFLDRLAELFSREKSSGRHGNREGSKHIAATAWIRSDTKASLTIVVAKNEGLDDRDREMSSKLQSWFRAVAATGRPSPILVDEIWIGDRGLVAYSRGRLWYHISQINQLDQLMINLAARSGTYGPVITRLRFLCQNATADSTVRQLSDIVNVAYTLRYVWKDLRTNVEHMKVLRSINMLGRLQAAYECFKSIALTFEEMSAMEMKHVELHQPMEINVALFRRYLQRLAKDLGLPKGLLKNNAAQKYT